MGSDPEILGWLPANVWFERIRSVSRTSCTRCAPMVRTSYLIPLESLILSLKKMGGRLGNGGWRKGVHGLMKGFCRALAGGVFVEEAWRNREGNREKKTMAFLFYSENAKKRGKPSCNSFF